MQASDRPSRVVRCGQRDLKKPPFNVYYSVNKKCTFITWSHPEIEDIHRIAYYA